MSSRNTLQRSHQQPQSDFLRHLQTHWRSAIRGHLQGQATHALRVFPTFASTCIQHLGPNKATAPQQTAKQTERDENRPCLTHFKKTAKAQDQSRKGFIFEQLGSSALWKEIGLPGHCRRNRSNNQCRRGAADEDGSPICKLSHLNFEFRKHMGQLHVWFQR